MTFTSHTGQYTAGNRTQLAADVGYAHDFINDYGYGGTYLPLVTGSPSNPLGQMAWVSQSGSSASGADAVAGKSAGFAYLMDGQFKSISRFQTAGPSSVPVVAKSTYAYNAAGQLTSLAYQYFNGPTTVTLDAFSYTYTARGDVATAANTLDGTVSYTNDATGQLTDP